MVTRDRFVEERTDEWAELEDLVAQAGRNPARLGPDRVRRLGAAYRAAAADLAIARRAWPGDPLVGWLERLVGRARHLVYDSARRRGGLREYATRGYWRRVRERPAFLLAAAALLFGPALLSGYWAWRDPGAAGGLAPTQFHGVTEPRAEGEDLGLASDEQAAISSQIITNNIQVSFLAFAGGILGGLGTMAVLLYNGVFLGAVTGLAIGAGNGVAFFELVSAHGVLELSCIVVAGAAGLRMGWAFVAPGYRPRAVALREEARAAVEVVLGTAVWLVVAGIVEGFVTGTGLELPAVLAVGFGLGVAYWALVLWLGRPDVGAAPADVLVTDARGPSA